MKTVVFACVYNDAAGPHLQSPRAIRTLSRFSSKCFAQASQQK